MSYEGQCFCGTVQIVVTRPRARPPTAVVEETAAPTVPVTPTDPSSSG